MDATRTAKDATSNVKERLVFYSEKGVKTDIKKEASNTGLSVSSYLNMIIKRELKRSA